MKSCPALKLLIDIARLDIRLWSHERAHDLVCSLFFTIPDMLDAICNFFFQIMFSIKFILKTLETGLDFERSSTQTHTHTNALAPVAVALRKALNLLGISGF